MSMLHSPAPQGQVIPLAKPPLYWLRLAKRHSKRGEHSQAAALLRHAISLDPASVDLRIEYARALRDMSCYEASIREAFQALTLERPGLAPYHVIGRNMLSLGRAQEALDAFSYCMDSRQELPAYTLHDGEEDLFIALEELMGQQAFRNAARLDALLHISSRRIANGNYPGAEQSLRRAARFDASDERLNALNAMLYEALEKHEEALACALLSAAQNPRNIPSLCSLASIRIQLGQRELACAALMKAAAACRYAQDEQLFCCTALALGMPELSLMMLNHTKEKYPHRLPTLYNCAVTLLQLGRLDDALAYLHQCRDLDPEDLAVQSLFLKAVQWKSEGVSSSDLRQKTQLLVCYPYLAADAVQGFVIELGDAFSKGMDAFAARLLHDKRLYRLFLYCTSLPDLSLAPLLHPVACSIAQTSHAAAERLLRDVLVQNTPGGASKHHALLSLSSLEMQPPYVVWQDGRIFQVLPHGSCTPSASALQRHTARRIQTISTIIGDKRMIPYMLYVLSRMTRRERYAFAADRNHVWTSALLCHFSHLYGGSAMNVSPDANPEMTRRINRVLTLIRKRLPIDREETPRSALSVTKEE